MVKSRTVHVVPTGEGWAVKRGAGKASVYANKRAAVARARDEAKKLDPGQMVVHKRDGTVSDVAYYGFPKIQQPPRRSRLGKKKIEHAVAKFVLDQLGFGTSATRD